MHRLGIGDGWQMCRCRANPWVPKSYRRYNLAIRHYADKFETGYSRAIGTVTQAIGADSTTLDNRCIVQSIATCAKLQGMQEAQAPARVANGLLARTLQWIDRCSAASRRERIAVIRVAENVALAELILRDKLRHHLTEESCRWLRVSLARARPLLAKFPSHSLQDFLVHVIDDLYTCLQNRDTHQRTLEGISDWRAIDIDAVRDDCYYNAFRATHENNVAVRPRFSSALAREINPQARSTGVAVSPWRSNLESRCTRANIFCTLYHAPHEVGRVTSYADRHPRPPIYFAICSE